MEITAEQSFLQKYLKMFSLDFHGLKDSTQRTLTKIWGVSKFQVQSWEHIKENEAVGSLLVIETNKRETTLTLKRNA